MEDQKTVSFMRLLSDESIESTLSSGSCEYYQTEIYELLPSVQAVRSQQDTYDTLKSSEAYHGGQGPEEGFGRDTQSRGPKEKVSLQPLRNLAMCMQGKRGARERRKMQISNIGFWESGRRSQCINRKKIWAQMRGAGFSLLPWQHTLHEIQGRFGIGVKSYFVFLRYLIYLNLLHSALIGGLVLGPTAFYGTNNSESLRFGTNDSVLDFFLGSGFLARSPVFFGFYTRGSLDLICLNTPLLYLAGILSIFFCSLIMIVRRTIVGYKHTWMLEKRTSMNVSFKIFCGWDFNIQDPVAAKLKHSFIRNDLKEQSFSLRKAQRTLKHKVCLYLLRLILNLVVLFLLVGAFCLIYFSGIITLELSQRPKHWFLNLVLQYLSPITITFVNLVLPHMFRKISAFEDYSLTFQVNATLVRSIFLKLASLGIYLFFIFNENLEHSSCRENQLGREMYKLCIFNFLTTFFNTFFMNYPRKVLQEKYPTSLLARLTGKQQFLIPFNVLDLVYIQTVSWVGVYYCPLLPLIGIVTLMAVFYIKKFSVLRCCVAEQRMFRASNSSVLFYFMLLLGLLMAATTLVLDFYWSKQANNFRISCGPFKNQESVFNVTNVCVKSLPSSAQTALHYLSSEAFALPLLLAEIIILTSYVSRGRANRKAIERLKDMLVLCSSDKRFLVKQHATLLRGQKNANRVRPVAVEQRKLLHEESL